MVLLCSLGWAGFLALHLALNGRWWPWLAVSLLPPVALAAVPLVLLAAALAGGAWGAAALAAGCLLVAWPQNGINARALLRRRGPRLRAGRGRGWCRGTPSTGTRAATRTASTPSCAVSTRTCTCSRST
ncbi:hypothetical protein AB6O49_23460 [Streptomyces sp. SBR177]